MKATTVSRVLLVAGLVTLGCLAACNRAPEPGASAKADALPWSHDLTTAMTRAGSQNKLVMVDFYTDWCTWCRRLDETTYADAGVQSALQGVVLVKLNAEKDGRSEATKYRVDGYPTVLFLNAQGAEVGRIPGYLPPGQFLAALQDILQRA